MSFHALPESRVFTSSIVMTPWIAQEVPDPEYDEDEDDDDEDQDDDGEGEDDEDPEETWWVASATAPRPSLLRYVPA